MSEPITIRKRNYRAVRFMLSENKRTWPIELWGLDFFFWHIPLLKTTLALDALIVLWLT